MSEEEEKEGSWGRSGPVEQESGSFQGIVRGWRRKDDPGIHEMFSVSLLN